MTLDQDTIAAIATPPGRGGIGVVRLSGPAARTALASVLTLSPKPRHAHFTHITDPAIGALLDEAIVTFYPAPHSYTGEDVLEIAPHGAPVILAFLIEQSLANGARLARPGEFTERAFLNRRLDLTQAEAVRDLIDASTLHQARLAAEQLGGSLSRRIAPTKQALLHLIATLEAGIDFAEDDIDVLPDARILAALDTIEPPLQTLANSFRYGRILHDGLTLAIIGPPNVGKSSLFNRLLDRDRAIVTATPGTTRDLVSERLSIAGVLVELIDTAGLRTTTDEAESLGIAKTYEATSSADLVLVVSDATDQPPAGHLALPPHLSAKPHLLVRNKIDLVPVAHEADACGFAETNVIDTSVLTGAGIEALRDAIATAIQGGASTESGVLTNLRQHDALTSSLRSIADAREAVRTHIPHEMMMLNLYAALHSIDSLTGFTTPDDILGVIFSTFCIGK